MRPSRPDKPERPPGADCRRAALDLLARREHSRRELRAKLGARGFDADAVEAVLDALEGEGLLDEQRFAESFVHSRLSRGVGAVRIRAELAERGVDAGTTERILDAAGADWLALAEQARSRRFGAAAPQDAREWVRQARFLRYRGFSGDQIRRVLGDWGD